jgi:hypothetical protein
MPHRITFTCHRTGAVVIRDYSASELACLYNAADRAELATGGTLHVRWGGMEPEHISITDASVPRRVAASNHPAPPHAEARP